MRSYKSILCCIVLNVATLLGLLCLFRITDDLHVNATPPSEEIPTNNFIQNEPTTSLVQEETTLTPEETTLSAEEQLQATLEQSLFIGNSRMEGLYKFTKAGEYSDFCCKSGNNISTIRKEPVASYPKQTILETVKQQQYKRIYICLGYNELGWKSMKQFINEYQEFITDLQQQSPNSEIYVLAILNVWGNSTILEPYENNQRITEFNTAIEAMCLNHEWAFINLNPLYIDENGNLPEEYTADGIHFTAAFCEKYLNSLLQ